MSRKVIGSAQLNAILQSSGDKLVVLDVGASWCGPCKQIAPVFEELANTHKNVVFAKADGDESRDLVAQLRVEGFPTFVFFKGSKEVDRLVGADESSLTRMVKSLSIKPEPVSKFSFPPSKLVFLGQQGTFVQIASFISGKLSTKESPLRPTEAAKWAAVVGAADEGVALAHLVKEPGILSKLLCDLLSNLSEEFQFSVVHLAAKLLATELGANALRLMEGTGLSFLGKLRDLAFGGKVETTESPKHLQNRQGLALEAVSNALCHEKTREIFLDAVLNHVPAPDVFFKLPERSQVAFATILLNCSIIIWRQRGPESLSCKVCSILLSLLGSLHAGHEVSSAALVRLLGAVGTNVFLVHVVNQREDAVQFDPEPVILLSSLDLDSFTKDAAAVVAAELKQAFQLPMQ